MGGVASVAKRAGSSEARIPGGMRIYAIGDLHGRADLLERLLAKIDQDLTAHPIRRAVQVFLGDYVDRGPSSRDVITRLIDRAHLHETVFLQGNHEVIFQEFLDNPQVFEHWRQFGGLDTLMSYDVKVPLRMTAAQLADLSAATYDALPPSHRSFLNQLIPWFSCGSYFFVHAGVRPGVALDAQRQEDLYWIREEFLNHERSFGKIIVHGHTPVDEPDIRPNRINIDTGAYATGRLTCLILEGSERRFL
jgi:calcineurin-like phosphoesterase family protein